MASTATSSLGAILQRFPLLAPRPASRRPPTTRRAVANKISCIGWDPEGILVPPQPGHIVQLEFRRRLDSAADARAAFDLQVKEEQERRRKERKVIHIHSVHDADNGGAREIEIGRLRPRLNKAFFDHIQREIAQIKFAVTETVVCTNLSSLFPLLCVSKLENSLNETFLTYKRAVG
ncbi:uncharacterized protein LOC123450703 [Hordeum vulgare subsp. vulgare]|uniref:uncharacterized protein LOC123450703 n=1 Tax=Hordeum vulgare subsp. vulgare TaxID=112509 RepID=UPI001D1A59AA|nr:uncharacterized protein LOC123450703 [Hordeum vulgare subsp. vulgare]